MKYVWHALYAISPHHTPRTKYDKFSSTVEYRTLPRLAFTVQLVAALLQDLPGREGEEFDCKHGS